MSKAPMPQKAQKKAGGTPTAIKGQGEKKTWVSQIRALRNQAPASPKK